VQDTPGFIALLLRAIVWESSERDRKQCSLWEIVQRESVKTMPRELLKAAEVPKLIAFNRGKGKFRDGAGLYLDVRAPGQASWAYQFRLAGKTLWGSIGPASIYSLADARDKHRDLRRVVPEGQDPRAAAGEAVGATFEVALTDTSRMRRPNGKAGQRERRPSPIGGRLIRYRPY
jgi:hypothetical protein